MSIVLIPSLAPPTKKDISKTFFDEHLTKAQNQNVLQGSRKKKKEEKSSFVSVFEESLRRSCPSRHVQQQPFTQSADYHI